MDKSTEPQLKRGLSERLHAFEALHRPRNHRWPCGTSTRKPSRYIGRRSTETQFRPIFASSKTAEQTTRSKNEWSSERQRKVPHIHHTRNATTKASVS